MAAGLLRVVVAPSTGSVPAGAGTKEAGTSDGHIAGAGFVPPARLQGYSATSHRICGFLTRVESVEFRRTWRRGATLSLLARSDIELLRGFRVRVMTHLTGSD